MPLTRCRKNGEKGWKWGPNGNHCFTGPDAKRRAAIQGYAVQKSQEREGKSTADVLRDKVLLRHIQAELEKPELSVELAAFADELIFAEESQLKENK